MTTEECQWLLANFRSPLVRVDPRASVDRSQHWGRARLLSVNKDYATVAPMAHKKTEVIHVKYLNKWTSRLEPKEGIVLTQNLGDFLKPKLQKEAPMPFKRKYTDSQVEEVIKLYNMGKQFDEIAVITNISRNSLGGIIYADKNQDKVIYRYKDKPKKRREVAKPVEASIIIPTMPSIPSTAPALPLLFKEERKIDKKDLRLAIRAMLEAPVDDSAKLLAIEALVS